jgi:hypothetical protein
MYLLAFPASETPQVFSSYIKMRQTMIGKGSKSMILKQTILPCFSLKNEIQLHSTNHSITNYFSFWW